MPAGLLELCTSRSSQPNKEDFARIMFPVKQIIALVIGLAMGTFQLTGLVSLGLYFAVATSIAYLYSMKYLEVEEDEIDGQTIFTESLGAGFSVFMLSWVLSYTVFNSSP